MRSASARGIPGNLAPHIDAINKRIDRSARQASGLRSGDYRLLWPVGKGGDAVHYLEEQPVALHNRLALMKSVRVLEESFASVACHINDLLVGELGANFLVTIAPE